MPRFSRVFPPSFAKLQDGSWGIRSAEQRQVGEVLTIQTRDGGSKQVTIKAKVGFNSYGDSLWSLVPQDKPAPAQARAVGDLGGVLALFDRAKANLKKPAIVVAVPEADTVIRLSLAGAKAKVPGSLTVTDNEVFESNDWGGESRVWLGRVTREGEYQPARKANGRTEAITAQLRRFAAEPAKVAKESAVLTGRCVFCNLALGGDSETAKKSLAVGYGQTCAANYGLPWGEVKLDIGKPE